MWQQRCGSSGTAAAGQSLPGVINLMINQRVTRAPQTSTDLDSYSTGPGACSVAVSLDGLDSYSTAT